MIKDNNDNSLLDENLSEKFTTKIELIEIPTYVEHEHFIKLKDFEKTVLIIGFTSFLTVMAGVII